MTNPVAKLGVPRTNRCIPSVIWLWAVNESVRGITPLHFVPNADSCSWCSSTSSSSPGAVERGRSASQSETYRMNKGVHPRTKKIFGIQGSRQWRDSAEHKEETDARSGLINSPWQRRRGRRKRGAVEIEVYLDVRGGRRRRACDAMLGWGRKERWSLESNTRPQGWLLTNTKYPQCHRLWRLDHGRLRVVDEHK